MNYFPFHIGDYTLHTRHLTLMQDLAYRRLLDLYYTSEGPIPGDAERCARLIGMRDHLADVQEVLAEFFVLTDGGHENKRAEEELAKFRRMSEGGKSGAAKRWAKGGDSPPIAPPSPPHSPPISNQNQNQNQNQKEEKTTPSALLPEVTESVLSDWVALRKAKKAPITATAVDGIRREARKAGYSVQQALETACLRGWVGFKAEWVRDGPQETSYQRSMRERVEQVAPAVARKDGAKPHPMEVLDGLTRANAELGLHEDGSGVRPRLPLEMGGAGHGSGQGGLDARDGRRSEQPGRDPARVGEPAR